jgi:hypothetical protein
MWGAVILDGVIDEVGEERKESTATYLEYKLKLKFIICLFENGVSDIK